MYPPGKRPLRSLGINPLRRSRRFGISSAVGKVAPVMFPPGRLRLSHAHDSTAFRRGLKDGDYIEGQNAAIDIAGRR
jgi:hypothetical protein